MRSIYYYSTTTITAVILGIILVVTIRPGEFNASHAIHNDTGRGGAPVRNVTTADTLLDLIRYSRFI